MAHFKRGRRKNARAGCRLCRPEKANVQKLRRRVRGSDLRRLDTADKKLDEHARGEDMANEMEHENLEDLE